MSGAAVREADRATQQTRTSPTVNRLARVGLVGRAGLYAALAYLAASVAAHAGRGGRQANANGVLSIVAAEPAGKAVLLLAAAGFAGFAAVRMASAVGDRDASTWHRLAAAGQALVYAALTVGTVAFVVGNRATGSEQQQHSTSAKLLGLPGGQVVLLVVGVAVVGLGLVQLWHVVTHRYDDPVETERMPSWLRRFACTAGPVALSARASVVVAVGAFLAYAAVRADPRQAIGLDAILTRLAQGTAGRVAVAAVAVGFAVFAAWSLLEARYRRVHTAG